MGLRERVRREIVCEGGKWVVIMENFNVKLE